MLRRWVIGLRGIHAERRREDDIRPVSNLRKLFTTREKRLIEAHTLSNTLAHQSRGCRYAKMGAQLRKRSAHATNRIGWGLCSFRDPCLNQIRPQLLQGCRRRPAPNHPAWSTPAKARNDRTNLCELLPRKPEAPGRFSSIHAVDSQFANLIL